MWHWPLLTSKIITSEVDGVLIVCISDTHNQHRDLKDMPAGDILIHAGDFTLVISDSVTCTEANVKDCAAATKTTITVKIVEEGFDMYKYK